MTLAKPFRRLGRASLLGASGALLTLAACGSESDERRIELGQAQLQLTRAASCDDLEAKIQSNVILELEELAKRLKSGDPDYGYGYVDTPTVGGTGGFAQNGDPIGNSLPPRAAPEPTGPGADLDDGAVLDGDGSVRDEAESIGEEGSSDSSGSANPGSSGFSGTTVQVRDVDEADIVKTDGDLLYLLHGGTLFVLNAWPADATQIVASALVEGEPTEMFVRNGKAVVFSRVWGDLKADGADPDRSYYYDGSGYTKITVLDVSAQAPSVTREAYVEGNYVSSRRHDGLVRAVVQDGFKVPRLGNPDIQYRDPFGDPFPQADIDAQVDAWLDRTRRAILNSEVTDWIPREFERVNGALAAVDPPRCQDYYAPDPGLTQQGVTSVVALDMDAADAPLRGATILGQAERVYSNSSALLVTQTDYRYRFTGEPIEQTIIHRFDIDGAETRYSASGAVRGYVHNQFSLDERNGVIRVSTTENLWNNVGIAEDTADFAVPMPGSATPALPPEGDGDVATDEALVDPAEPMPDEMGTAEEDPAAADGDQTAATDPVDKQTVNGPVNRVVTLGTEGRDLVVLGQTEDFGLTERIYATRFMGDRAYVVTFRRTDPLFVLDMSDDENPTIVGELHIPGFSDYLYPLGDDHLFAIGQDATEDGRVTGLALQIFDVSDATNPTLAHRHVYEGNGHSPANIDHRAINFHQNGNLVAFPYRNYALGENTLEVFSISAEAGLQRLGGMGSGLEVSVEDCLRSWGWDEQSIASELQQIEQSPEWQAEILWECNAQESFRRGLFRDDVVYGISTGGVYAYDVNALDGGALGQVSLPAEVWDHRNYSGDGEDGFRGDPIPATAAGGASGEMTTSSGSSNPVDVGAPGDSAGSDDSTEEVVLEQDAGAAEAQPAADQAAE